jgi:hypothetical protein
MQFAYDFMGTDRLLYASDHPWVDPNLIRSTFESLNLPAADRITFTFAKSFARPHRRACRGWKNWRYMAGDICGPFCIPRSSPNTITSMPTR